VTIHLNPDDILDNKQLSMFYGGCIGRIEYGKYVIAIHAYGDIRANLYVDGCNVCYVKDKGNDASFAHETRNLIASDIALSNLTVYCHPDEDIFNNTCMPVVHSSFESIEERALDVQHYYKVFEEHMRVWVTV